ncbi:MAG: fibronectin type III domain-containing protein [Pirellulales bacterium]|nr:fibronectin type III domain-containing protein [Pirellulales bacterium]
MVLRHLCRNIFGFLVAAFWLAAAGIAAGQDGRFDPTSIGLPRNLASNPSFEAARQSRGAPDDWDFYANPQYMSLVREGALHGAHAVLVDRPQLTGIVHVAAKQVVPITPDCEYTLSAWVNVELSEGGTVSIYLDFLDAQKNRMAIRQVSRTKPTEGWEKLSLTARAPAAAAFAQLLVPYVDGRMRVRTDCVALESDDGGRPAAQGTVRDLAASRPTSSSVYLAWKSPWEHHEIEFRPEGASQWTTIRNVWSEFHNVIQLEPQTQYQFRVRALPPQRLDENGKPTTAAEPVVSEAIGAATIAEQPKLWEGLKLWPTRHVPTFPDDQAYPCIESYQDAFYLVEARGSAIHLSKLRKSDFGVEWTREIVPRVKEVSSYQGIPDTCVFQDKLWVMWNRQATGDPKYEIMDSRQHVLTYDFATQRLSDPITIEATQPGCGAWEGGLTVYRGKLWMMWLEAKLNEENRRRTRIVLRPYEDGRFTDTVVFDSCPSVYPYGPSINVFEDRMILLWSDLAASEKEADHEPLYCTFFDGRSFSSSVLLHDKGRSRYAKGAQFGDRFYCVYKCNSQYPGSGYMYHDLALTWIAADAGQITTTYWVDDVKYNSSPDMTCDGDRLVVVYGKFEHAYGRRHDPALNHGTFLGLITK